MGCEIWIVIPTYWGSPDVGIYDHPTPLDGESTLPALLDSLVDQNFQTPFHVLILVSSVSDGLDPLATSRVKEIAHRYASQLNLVIADSATSVSLGGHLRTFGIDLGIRDLRGYAAVRNMQLLIPALLGAQTIIALDDDEIVATDYLKKATEKIGSQIREERIVGLAGPYLDEAGSPYIQEPDQQTNLLLDKAILINQTMRRLCVDRASLSPSPIAFGGNMVFHRDLFTQVGFDPGITRGEDIDYLINARIAGFQFYFDPALTIIHRPPRQYEAPLYAKLRQDVIRFQYEKMKVIHFGLSIEDLRAYPGGLLVDGFSEMAINALKQVSTPELESKYGTPEEILEYSEKEGIRKLEDYQRFNLQWPEAIGRMRDLMITSKIGILENLIRVQ